MTRVLLVDDDVALAGMLREYLHGEGFDATTAHDGETGVAEALSGRYAIVVLDVMLPRLSGVEALRRIRTQSRVPVLMLTAKGDDVDRIVGLELGADDYVVKPFSVRELVLRVRAILRRAESQPAPSDIVEFGCLKIDRGAHRVFVNDQEVQLTALEFRLLSTLHERRNRTQARDTLLLDVWQMNTPVESRTVDTHVKRLREKLGAASSYIRTVRGVGYRFASSPDEPGGD